MIAPKVQAAPAHDPLAMTADGSAPPPAQALPFKPGSGAKPKRVSLEPHAALGQTAPLSPKKADKPEVPFQGDAAPPSGAPQLSLELYAHFCAERTRWPDHQARTCAKYGVAPADEEAIHRHYRARLESEPAVAVEFERYRAIAMARIYGDS